MGAGVGHAARRFVQDALTRAAGNNQPICLDSSALVAVLAGEPARAQLVRYILTDPDSEYIISTVSLAEVIVRPAAAGDQDSVDRILSDLSGLPRLTIADFTRAHALETAFVRVQTGLKFPDAAIVATARLANAHTVIASG